MVEIARIIFALKNISPSILKWTCFWIVVRTFTFPRFRVVPIFLRTPCIEEVEITEN